MTSSSSDGKPERHRDPKHEPDSLEALGRNSWPPSQCLQTPSPPLSGHLFHANPATKSSNLNSGRPSYAPVIQRPGRTPKSRCSMESPRSRQHWSSVSRKRPYTRTTSADNPLQSSSASDIPYYSTTLHPSPCSTCMSEPPYSYIPTTSPKRKTSSSAPNSRSHTTNSPSESSSSTSGCRSCYLSASSTSFKSRQSPCSSISPSRSSTSSPDQSSYLSARNITPTASEISDYKSALSSQISTPIDLPGRHPLSQYGITPCRSSSTGHPLSAINSDSHCDQSFIAKYPTHSELIASPHLISITDSAVSAYDSALERIDLSVPNDSSPTPFWVWPAETLEYHFEAIIDAQNALLLRRSAVLVDIGLNLETLTSQISLYDKDSARLICIKDELERLMEACANRHLDLDFDTLERYRSSVPPYTPSFIETHQLLFWEKQALIDKRRDAQTVGLSFLQDPMALREYRLPKFVMSQR